MLYVVWAVALVASLVLYCRQVYSRFSRHGVRHRRPVPLLGNMTRLMLRLDHFTEDVDKSYAAFPGERFVGNYEFVKPTIILRDLELIKRVGVKDFDHFLDHRGFTDESIEPLFARNLFSLRGDEWKDMRSTLSPAFTSSKIRLMVPFMQEAGNQMMEALKKDIEQSKTGYIDVDFKDLASRFANDVIASCAFGLQVDSHRDRDNRFYEMGRVASTFKFKQLLMLFLNSAFPTLFKSLRLKFFSEETKNFFLDLVLGTMRERAARDVVRHDMIHLLMQAKKGKLTHDESTRDADAGFATVEESDALKKTVDREWSDVDLVAQAVLFFIGGFESVSIAMSFALHEIALRPYVQERLYREISETDEQNKGRIDYTSIQRMQYLDMVVSEVLRLWPVGVIMDRVCTREYNLGKANDDATDYIMRKGDVLTVPVWSIHRDPQYFSDPLKFDPERFSDDNKHSIHPMAYMPFGVGPRNCIGSRFALCELKVLLYMIILNMEVSPNDKTATTNKMSTDSFNIRFKDGHWLRLKPRH
ncbi:cytochrome P450 9e2-like [Aricia agestis]|uniref:cytochrome P450 9e2-like n=1 Tax=Aricia agestis TaxID=91739 RepID=UPI001C20AEB3|nr:cytochrome P450 9e2-like [Aricia agestis]